MKRFLIFVLSLLIAVVPVFGCDSAEKTGNGGNTGAVIPDNAQPAIVLNRTNMSMGLFGEFLLTATLNGVSSVEWINGNSDVLEATETESGYKIVAVGFGTSIITAKSGKESAQCVVTVSATNEKMALSVARDQVEVRKEGKLSVPATVRYGGETFTKANVIYTIVDTLIAEVSNDGIVTGKAAGQTTLIVRAELYGHTSNVVAIPVIVKDGPVMILSTANVNLFDVKAETPDYPNQKELTVSIVDGDGTKLIENYVAQSSDGSIATVEDGVIKAKGEGNTIISVSCEYGGQQYSGEIRVSVSRTPAVTIEFSESTVSMYAPEEDVDPYTHQLRASVKVGGKEVSASDLYYAVETGVEVVSVNADTGVITSLSAGTATVSANYDFAGETYKSTCTVVVTPNASVYFGQHLEWAHDGVIATLEKTDALAITDVTIPTVNDGLSTSDSLFRFQLIPETIGHAANYDPYGPAVIFITIQDATDSNNYITVLIRQYPDHNDKHYDTHSSVGVRASTFGKYSEGDIFYGQDMADLNHKQNKLTAPGSAYGKCTNSFSFTGHYLKQNDYQPYMIGIVLNGTTLYYQSAGELLKIWDLSNFTGVSDMAGKEWGGFASNKVNIFVKFAYFKNQSTSATLSVDVLGGTTLGASNVSKFRVVDCEESAFIPAGYSAK